MSKFSIDLGVIGLGYVGLPLVVESTNSGLSVFGFDNNSEKINDLKNGNSPIEDISDNELKESLSNGLLLSDSPEQLKDCEHIVISVPTPLTDYQPDLSYVKEAAKSIGENISKEQIVILESTTYPGTTIEVLIPEIEEVSGLNAGKDFYVGYSPERIDPGNEVWGFKNTPKVISGIDETSTEKIKKFYEKIIDEVVVVSGTREAEMVKLLENTYRHVNIAFINELAVLCNMLEIDIWEVIDAAKTKPFGFESFRPGPGVGGHCIPIDPNYLSFKTRQIGKPVRFVELAQEINNTMPTYIVGRVLEMMNKLGKPMNNSSILLFGVAYKKDISDTRESPALHIIENLQSQGVNIGFYDPFVEELDTSVPINKETDLSKISKYDLILFHTPHSQFEEINFEEIEVPIFDATGVEYLKNYERI